MNREWFSVFLSASQNISWILFEQNEMWQNNSDILIIVDLLNEFFMILFKRRITFFKSFCFQNLSKSKKIKVSLFICKFKKENVLFVFNEIEISQTLLKNKY